MRVDAYMPYNLCANLWRFLLSFHSKVIRLTVHLKEQITLI